MRRRRSEYSGRAQPGISEEIQRATRIGNNDDRYCGIGILRLQIIAQQQRLVFAREPVGIQILGIVSRCPGRSRIQTASKSAVEFYIGGVIPIIPVQSPAHVLTGLASRARNADEDVAYPRRKRQAPLRRISTTLHQRITLMPNWICRDDPDSPVGKRVFVIRPKPGVPTTFPGWPKFAWLKRSKTSTRN